MKATIAPEHLRLADLTARRAFRSHRARGVTLDDCKLAALEGLFEAKGRFDPSRGVKFETFASRRMHGAVLDFVRAMQEIPRGQQEKRRLLGLDDPLPVTHRREKPLTLAEVLPDKRKSRCEEIESYDEVELLLADLPAREREVVKRYDLGGELLREVGDRLGFSESRTQQIRAKALNRLRRLHKRRGAAR